MEKRKIEKRWNEEGKNLLSIIRTGYTQGYVEQKETTTIFAPDRERL